VNLWSFIGRRLLLLGPMLIGITLFSFLLSHAVPADPVSANLGEQAAADPEVVAAFRKAWGLDRPLHEQYLLYVWNLARGDFGTSISTKQAVALDLRQRFPATVEVAIVAMIISLAVGVPLGILSAVKRDSIVDQIARVLSLVGVSMPVFWLGLVALLVFYARLGWAPAPGRLSANLIPPTFATGFLLIDSLREWRIDAALDAPEHLERGGPSLEPESALGPEAGLIAAVACAVHADAEHLHQHAAPVGHLGDRRLGELRQVHRVRRAGEDGDRLHHRGLGLGGRTGRSRGRGGAAAISAGHGLLLGAR